MFVSFPFFVCLFFSFSLSVFFFLFVLFLFFSSFTLSTRENNKHTRLLVGIGNQVDSLVCPHHQANTDKFNVQFQAIWQCRYFNSQWRHTDDRSHFLRQPWSIVVHYLSIVCVHVNNAWIDSYVTAITHQW